MNEKISIIVPVYNVEKYIHRCLDSIIYQTYENLEIILVDDGSPDGCGKICDEYAKQDSRIKVIHQKNGGQSKARNEAMKIATGDYFCFVDSDDYINEKYIERLYDLIIESNVDISMVNYCNFTGELVQDADILSAGSNSSKFNNIDLIKNMHMITDELYVVMWGKLFKRDLFQDIQFPEGRICEDLAVLYRLYDKVKSAVYSSEILYYYFRDNADSSTFRIKDKFYDDVYLALDEEIEYMQKNHVELVNYPCKTYMYWLFDYYRKLVKVSPINKEKLTQLHAKYKELYRVCKDLKKDKFYTAFYYCPRLYLKIKNM